MKTQFNLSLLGLKPRNEYVSPHCCSALPRNNCGLTRMLRGGKNSQKHLRW